jgi:hypothetical protein
MICNCGSETKDKVSTWRGIDLEYVQCPSCGRCGMWRMGGITGEPARKDYLERKRKMGLRRNMECQNKS